MALRKSASVRLAVKCCRSTPRCRNCPARKIDNDDLLRALGIPVAEPLPPHLRGVPPSLHKYEPLLRRSFEQRATVEV
ncbi:MAG: hypothetical protein QOK00_1695 [Thermoleophilaceae bacterium]|nr:hypothetical protein [Thermoleophilaceae bacterium]MEA2401292.1 hypothetical protein [Thermoleophilaceae bacterium]MEA2455543.1 hypothetical protein [Thermoleophilaceae bacterium]